MKLIGDGGYRELSHKRFELWQFVEVDGRRKQRTKRVRCGKRDVGEALRAFQSELADQLPPADSFSAYAASWCAWRRSSGRYSDHTCADYESALRILGGYVGNVPLSELTANAMRDALMALKEDRRLSNTTMRMYYAVASKMLSSAVDEGVAAHNPMKAIDRPKPDTEERDALSPAEMDALWLSIAAEPPSVGSMAAMLALDAGLRVGECVALADSDVSEDSVTVTESKTEAGRGRTVPMTSRLRVKCAEWREDRERRGIADAPTFLCLPNGSPAGTHTVRRWYNANRERLGAPGRFHDLRHSNLSKMARFMGAHDLQRWAGWSGLEMAQRYVHDDYSQLVSAVRRSENVGGMLGLSD